MKKVVIEVVSTQTDATGDQSRIEFCTIGSLAEKNGIRYVSYRETEVSGMDGASTLLKIYPDRVLLLRRGAVEQDMDFSPGRRCHTDYVTPYGTIELDVLTESLTVTEKADSLVVEAAYELAMNNSWQSHNTLSVNIREEESHECERTTH